MSRWSPLCLVPLLCAFAPAPLVSGSSDEIVVHGETERQTIAQFVAQLAPAAGDSQLGKFVQPVCPAVAGLAPDTNRSLAERMRKVAKAAEVLVAAEGCSPNVLVFVVPNKAAAIDAMRRQRPDLLGRLPAAEVRKIAEDPSPVAAWQIVDELGADGMPLPAIRVATDSDPMPSDPIRNVRSFGFTSRVKSLTVPQFVGAVVLVEQGLARDATPVQLADYAMIRALVGTSDATKPPSQSILNLVVADRSGTAAPLSVTGWDLALVKSLYSTSNALSATAQRNEIAEQMQRELRAGSPQH